MIELLLQAERALSVGLLDRADVLYRQVAKADPRNSIAVVGLARVTLDRGDDVGALALARKAMAIDPENTAAQRMVARLEEVLDFRDAARDLDPAGAPPVDAEVEADGEAEAEGQARSRPTGGADAWSGRGQGLGHGAVEAAESRAVEASAGRSPSRHPSPDPRSWGPRRSSLVRDPPPWPPNRSRPTPSLRPRRPERDGRSLMPKRPRSLRSPGLRRRQPEPGARRRTSAD